MGRRKADSDRLVQYLETRILAGTFRAGELLPSVRRLAGRFDLSYGTAYRTMEWLCTEGWLEKRLGDGFFVKAPPAADDFGIRVGVVLEVSNEKINSGFLCYHALLGIRSAAAEHNISLKIFYVHCDRLTEDLVREMAASVAGLIFIGSYDWKMWSMQLPCPAAGILMLRAYNGQVSTVNIDIYDTVMQAFDFFGRAVVKRHVVYTSIRPIFMAIAQRYCDEVRAVGGKVELITGMPEERLNFEAGVGYFFTSDQMLQQVSEWYKARNGVPLSEHHLVLGVDGKRLINPEYHRFPTIALDWCEVGRAALEELYRRLNDPESSGRSQSLCGKLIMP